MLLTLQPNLGEIHSISGSAVGEATTTIDVDRILQFIASAVAEAEAECQTEVIFPVSNPTLAGDLVDIQNNSVFQLTVDGTLIDFSTECFNVNDLIINYDQRELSFSEITGIDSPTFAPEDPVTLEIDFTGVGSTLERIFTGKVRERVVIGQNNNEEIVYTCLGNQGLSSDITLLNTDGRPEIQFTVGVTVTSVTSEGTDVTTSFSKRIREAIQEVFEISNTLLGSASIPSTIGAPGLEQFTGFLPETVRFENTRFGAAITQLAAYQEGVKPFWDDKTQTWVFHNIYTVKAGLISVDSMNVMGLEYGKSTEERFTAVELYAEAEDALDEAIITQTGSIRINGRDGSIERTEITLTPFWLADFEDDWTITKALNGNPFTLESENFWVYKRWKMPQNIEDQWPGTPIRAWQKVNVWGVEKWLKLHGRAIFSRRLFLSRFHAVHRGNPLVPGDVIGPLEVRLTYYPKRFNFTYNTTVNSAGTPTTATTLLDSADFLDSIRYPSSGFIGTAFEDFGVERVLTKIVDKTEVTTANAAALLDIYKDIIIEGDIPIDGDPLPGMIHLGTSARVTHSSRQTGIESRNAVVTQYTYRFGKRGESTISLTTDVAGLVGNR